MAKTRKEVIESASKEVMFDFETIEANPNDFTEWLSVGDKGAPFEFLEDEVIELPPFKDIKLWGRHKSIGKKKYAFLYTAIKCSRQGWQEVPISIFRRMPSLQQEVALLKENNQYGAPLINEMNDVKRLAMLSKLAKTDKILVTGIDLHRNDFDPNTGKVIKDDPAKEEKDRKPLHCYKFNPYINKD